MLKKYKKFLISPMIVTIIILIIYFLKGIYPFGKATIANGDMGQSYMPFYYFLYDVVNNGKCIFYDYTLGMGSNMYGGFIIDGLLNFSTFIILLGKRENIPYMFSFVMIIKMSFIALTAYILFNRLNKENDFYNIIFSVLYALSGYSLTYNTNLMWLDVVGLFPLFVLSIKYMFETDKIHWYSIILSLMLIFNYNLAYMVLMFIIFIIPIYIKLGIKKEDRKKAVFNIIIGTILSVGLSAFAFIPSFVQTMSSFRMSGAVTNTVTNKNILYKIVIFIFYSLPIYGYIKWCKYYKDDKKEFTILGLSLIFSAILPIIFERINLLWHTGSYQLFPFRYGFIPTLILYIGSLRYFAKFSKLEKTDEEVWNTVKNLNALLVIAIFTLEICSAYIININMPAFFMNSGMFEIILVNCIFTYIFINASFNISNTKIRGKIIILLTTMQIMVYTYAYIGVPKEYRYGTEWSDEQIFMSNQIYNALKNENDTKYKLKDLTASTTENCSLVYNIPSISTFLHIIPTEQVLNHHQMGYSNRSTQINDFGGTLVSDAIYGIRYVLSKEELPDEIYTFIDYINEDIRLYEYKNYLSIGILYDNDVYDIPKELENFDAQNYLYKNLFNKENDIIEIDENLEIRQIEDGKYKLLISNLINKELYLNSNVVLENIKINGKEKIIPIINDRDNKIYKTPYCNGILDLGYFENENILEIEFESQELIDKNSIQIGKLDIEKYNQIFEDYKNNINIEIKSNKIKIDGKIDKNGQKLFIPINYDKEWRCIKGDTKINRIYNTFIGIELKEGNNKIELEFKPPLFDTCVKVTIGTIILMIFMYFIEKKLNIRNVKIVMFVFWILGIIIYILAFIKIYAISIFQTIISFFYNLY